MVYKEMSRSENSTRRMMCSAVEKDIGEVVGIKVEKILRRWKIWQTNSVRSLSW